MISGDNLIAKLIFDIRTHISLPTPVQIIIIAFFVFILWNIMIDNDR